MPSSKIDTVHVITSVQRRRRWSVFENKSIVEEIYEPGKSVSYVARKHGVAASQVFMWRRKIEEEVLVGIKSEETVVPQTEYKQALEERLLGQKTSMVRSILFTVYRVSGRIVRKYPISDKLKI
ncbi:hypothetical protein IM40_09455 (plasmid) [Candidatus Paracaedimonas acanthamoebae]|nr:hypothetical protein IM40_09455 [Candidatus Paracaedimonas acanthamoebae]